MKLSRSDFLDVYNALANQRTTGDARPGSDKRGGTRMRIEREVLIVTLAPDGTTGKPFTALTRDISHAGLGLFQRHRVPQNGMLIVRLPRANLEPLVLLCKAIHVRELAEGVYAVGAEFVKETTLVTPGGSPMKVDPAEIDRVRKAMMD